MTARTEIRAGGLRLSKNPEGFPTKGLQSAARRICVPVAHKFHTCSLSSIFSHAHVARENDFTFLPPAGANSTRFFDKLSARAEICAGGFLYGAKTRAFPVQPRDSER
jgi:hypothetical protein